MKVIVKGVHLSLTERMKQYVQAHLVEPLARFFDNEAAELDIHLVDNNGPKGGGQDKECRVTAFFPGSTPHHVTEATDDIYKSIDLARDRLERVLKRELERMREPTGHPSLKPAAQFGRALGGEIPTGGEAEADVTE